MVENRKASWTMAIAAMGVSFLVGCSGEVVGTGPMTQAEAPDTGESPAPRIAVEPQEDASADTKKEEKDATPDAPPAPFCGDGKVDPGEECDGDKNTCNGCDSSCHIRQVLNVTAGGSLTVPSLGTDLPDGDLTVEAWAKVSGNTTYLSSRISDEDTHLQVKCVDGWVNVTLVSPATQTLPPRSLQVEANVGCADSMWHHFAVTRKVEPVAVQGGFFVTFNVFWDGTSVANGKLGAHSLGTKAPLVVNPVGQLDELRVSSTIRYTSTFAPTKGHASDAATLLLLSFDGAVQDTSSHARPVTTVGKTALLPGEGGCQ
jgi:hypothetical protein